MLCILWFRSDLGLGLGLDLGLGVGLDLALGLVPQLIECMAQFIESATQFIMVPIHKMHPTSTLQVT